jgi:hypothetical protein
MTRDGTPEQAFPSTTWRWKHVILKAPAPPQRDSAPSGAPPRPLKPRNPRAPITVTVAYSGGSEAWWVITARGREWRIPGDRCLHDVMAKINRS